MSVATLGIAVDSSQATAAAKALDSLTAAAKPAAQAATDLNKATAGAATGATTMSSAVEKLDKAHAGLTAQGQAALHSVRSMAEQLALGIPPTQALAGQINHLTYAASGEGGLIGAFGQVGKMVGGAATSLLTFVTPAIAVTAAVGTMAAGSLAAAASWQSSQSSIAKSLTGLGAISGATVEDINAVGISASRTGDLSVQAATEIASGFAATGKIVPQSLEPAVQATEQLSKALGVDVSDAAKMVAQALADPAKGAEDLRTKIGGFSVATEDAIDKAQRMRDPLQAQALLLQELIRATADASKANEGFGTSFEKLWNQVKSGAYLLGGDLVKGFQQVRQDLGGPIASAGVSKQDQLAVAQDRLSNLESIPQDRYDQMAGGAAGAQKQIQQLKDTIAQLNSEIASGNAAKLAAEMDEVARNARAAVASLDPSIDQIKQLDQQITDLTKARDLKITANLPTGEIEAMITKANNLREATADAAVQQQQYNQRVQEISASWDSVSQSTALSLQAAQNQLPVIEAVGGAAKMSAQYAADYANAIDQGKTATDAAAEAASHLQASQAAVNSAAKEQLAALQDQYAVLSAITPLEQARAQAAATYNGLIRQGVDQQLAGDIAAQQQQNALARDNAQHVKQQQQAYDKQADQADQIYDANQKTVRSSEQQLELIQAQGTDMEATVKASIAYDNAMANGATYTQAATIWANTLQAAMLSVKDAAYEAAQAAYEAAYGVSGMVAGGNTGSYKSTSGTFEPDVMDAQTGVTAISRAYSGAYYADQRLASAPDYVNQLVSQGDYAGAILAAENQQVAGSGMTRGPTTANLPTVDTQMAQVDQLTQMLNSRTSDKSAQISNLQSELAWLNTLPETIARDQKIVDLQKSIDDLKNSTDGLNATNQDLLSPYYTQDPRTSHIGFRSQGMATGGYVDVPGTPSANDNMLAIIPVASGERISVDPMPSKRGVGGTTVSVVNHITIAGNASKDEVGRTMFQIGQRMAKQLAAAGR